MSFKDFLDDITKAAVANQKTTVEFGPEVAADLASQTAGMMAHMQTVFAPVIEGTTGYKNQLVQNGFSEQIAEVMAAEYHRAIVSFVLASMT